MLMMMMMMIVTITLKNNYLMYLFHILGIESATIGGIDHGTLPNCHPLFAQNRFQAKQCVASYLDGIPKVHNFSLMWIQNSFLVKVAKGGYQ